MGLEFEVKELDEKSLDMYQDSFFETLGNLKLVGDVGNERAKQILSKIREQGSHIYVAHRKDDGEIIGALTLMMEQKFIREGGVCGHIEDVSTRKGYEKNGVGRALVEHAVSKAREGGAYKVILDCADYNLKFYENCGFKKSENCMKIYF